jgi:hypothetical protein
MKVLCPSPAAIMLAAILTASQAADLQSQAAPTRDSVFRVLRRSGADSALVGDVPFFYLRSRAERARDFASMVDEDLQWYKDSSGIVTHAAVAFLDSARWGLVNGSRNPFGLPNFNLRMGILYMPSTPDGGVAHAYQTVGALIPESTRVVLREQDLRWTDAIERVFGLHGLHEIGHGLERSAGIQPPTIWTDELFATYFAYAFVRTRHSEIARTWDAVADAYVAAASPTHRSLADFETRYRGVGIETFVWYQSVLQQLVRSIYREQGFAFVRRLQLEFGSADPTALASCYGSAVPSCAAGVISRLDKIAPGFAARIAAAFAEHP